MDYNLIWQIFGGIVLFIIAFVTIRFKTSNNEQQMKDHKDVHDKDIKDINKTLEKIFERLDRHGDDIVEMKSDSKRYMTSEAVDAKYMSKEMFNQFEKHVDRRFDEIRDGQGKILDFMKELKKEGVR